MAAPNTSNSTMLRVFQQGDIGLIIHHQMRLYHEEYGWNVEFEGLVAKIAGEFILNFKPGREQCWVAQEAGNLLGSVMIVEASAEIAKLRLLWVAREARGRGVGSALVDQAIAFSRAAGYQSITLWTQASLSSARRLYQSRGFRLASEAPHHSFGQNHLGQNWDVHL